MNPSTLSLQKSPLPEIKWSMPYLSELPGLKALGIDNGSAVARSPNHEQPLVLRLMVVPLLRAQIGHRTEYPMIPVFRQITLGPVETLDEFLDQPGPQGRLHLHNDDLLPIVGNDVELVVLPPPGSLYARVEVS